MAGGVPELQEERLVRQLAGVVGEVFRGQIVAQPAADMVLAALVVGHRHAVQAHQPQRVERHFQRALADLRVGDAEPELHDVTPAYLELQLRQHGGHVELALRELALLDLDVGMLVERRQRRLDQVAVVQRPELVGEDGPGFAGERADQPVFVVLGLEPVVDVGRQQRRLVPAHPVVIGLWDLGELAQVAVGIVAQPARAQPLDLEVGPVGIHLEAVPGAGEEILLQSLLAVDLARQVVHGHVH